jgi:RimJ/RimL family protein N-acetyltransferase
MEFDLQPHLIGSLVELRPLRASDFEALFTISSDPLLWEQHPEPDRFKREIFEGFFEQAMGSKGAFAILDRKTGRIIGSSRYYRAHFDERELAIGYTFIDRAFWGTGYNPDAKKLLVEHAFKFVDRVFFEVGAQNIRSRKAMENIGGKLILETELPARDGGMRPIAVYGMSKT